MLAFGSDVFTGQATTQKAHGAVTNLSWAARSADITAYAVKGSMSGLFVFAPLRISDILHNIEALRTALSAGVAANAAENLRIKLTYDIIAGLNLVNIKGAFIDGEGVDFAYAHALLHLSLAGKHNLQLSGTLNAVNYGAGAAEAAATAAATNQLKACILHSVHNGQGCRLSLIHI